MTNRSFSTNSCSVLQPTATFLDIRSSSKGPSLFPVNKIKQSHPCPKTQLFWKGNHEQQTSSSRTQEISPEWKAQKFPPGTKGNAGDENMPVPKSIAWLQLVGGKPLKHGTLDVHGSQNVEKRKKQTCFGLSSTQPCPWTPICLNKDRPLEFVSCSWQPGEWWHCQHTYSEQSTHQSGVLSPVAPCARQQQ